MNTKTNDICPNNKWINNGHIFLLFPSQYIHNESLFLISAGSEGDQNAQTPGSDGNPDDRAYPSSGERHTELSTDLLLSFFTSFNFFSLFSMIIISESLLWKSFIIKDLAWNSQIRRQGGGLFMFTIYFIVFYYCWEILLAPPVFLYLFPLKIFLCKETCSSSKNYVPPQRNMFLLKELCSSANKYVPL